MRQILGNGRCARYFGGSSASDYRKFLGWPLAIFALVGLACGMLASLGTSARANDVSGIGDPIAALRSYVQSVDAAQGQPNLVVAPSAVADNDFSGDIYAPLRGFSQRAVAEHDPAIKDLPKVAEAGSLMEWLQQGGSQQGAATPAQPAAPAPKAAKGGKPKPPEPVVAATFIGSKVCLGCHAGQMDSFGYTLMGRLQKQGKIDCETCHGPGSAHVKAGGGVGVGGIISFRSDDTSRSAEENNGICLGCHERGERAYWEGSVHEVRGLACTNCHTIMKSVSAEHQLKTAFEPDTCFQCHKDRRAQMFRSSHMPMREGKVTCTNCHNPHGSVTEALLRQDSINDNCYTCHAEKRGPFLFEHAPVRENCLNCHDPHGSINEFSLKMSRPRLCFECHSIGHAETTGINSSLTMGRACQNCHQYIHGSNSPAGGALQR